MRRGRLKLGHLAGVEPLEPRQLLAASAVISEFMAVNESTLADDDGDFSDWIEIHNPTSEALSLANWYLTDDADNFPQWQFPDVTLPPGAYQVIYASGKDRADANLPLHTDFRLNGNGEFLAIVRPDGQTVEHGFAPEFPAQVADVSFGMSDDAAQQGFFTVPTPGAANAQAPIDDPLRTVVINEIMYHPPSDQTADEFVELFNRGTQDVSLRGWRLSSGLDFVFPDVTLAAGQYLVVAADVDVFRATYGGPADVVGPWSGRLSNSSDTITLRDDVDRRIDRVTYADEGEWARRARGPVDRGHQGWVWLDEHDGGGKSLELIKAAMPNEFGQNWGASLDDSGTPGRANSVASDDIAPLILETRHAPIIPGVGDAVTVETRIIADASREVDVALHWRVDGTELFNQVAMLDDGLNADRLAGDQVFVATIPAHADLTVIEFYVEARDVAANSRSWPAVTADSGQVTNALYQVFDSFDANAAWQTGRHPAYYEIMTAAEREEFRTINRQSTAQMNATFISVNNDGVKVRHNTGVRIRGSGSRNANPPNNRINIPADRPWEGVTAINLNVTTIQDQIAGSALFRLAGLLAADAKAVTLISNGRNLMAEARNMPFYAHVEPLNSDFANKHFPDDPNGNLYKGRRPNESPPGGAGAGLTYEGPDPGPYVSYTKLTNASEADWSDVIGLTDALNNAPDETYLDDAASVADIDQWLRFIGFNALVGNTEGGLANGDARGDDYAMYRGIEDPRFRMIPHDLDSLFSGVTRDIFLATNVPALRRLMLHPDVRPRYYQHLKDMIQLLLSDDARAAVEESLRGVQTAGQIDSIMIYLRNRANYVLSMIPEGVQLESHLPLQQGLRASNETTAELHGVADFRAQSVTINGQPASFDSRNRWELGSFIAVALPRSHWTYLDNGTDPGPRWKDFDFVPNADWQVGRAKLGYGDGNETTVIGFGGDPNDKHITTYFRHEFDLENASRYLSLNLQLRRDDGAVVYLNGVEVTRSNLPQGVITAETLAINNVSGGGERVFHDFAVDAALLREGKNVVAVEVHQVNATSPDLGFDLRMTGRYRQPNGIPLNPGVNRLVVRAMSDENGEGEVIASDYIDVWYDDGDVQPVTTDLPAGKTVWSAASGPYEVRGTITIPADAELTIEPGTSVHFAQDAGLVVNGSLIAQGTADQRIRFTSIPGLPFVPDRPGLPDGPARWDGIHFVDSASDDNRIAFADIEYAQDSNGSIGVESSSLVVDSASFHGTHLRMIYGSNASLVVRNSTFPDMFAADEDPAVLNLDNISEHIKIVGRTPAGGQLLIEGNEFGTNKGHNDVIDADSNRVSQGPILQILNNVFHGVGDELLDLGGDVYVAGNLFRHVSKDDSTSDRGYANAISTGDAGSNTTIVVARNVFYDVDHAINLKNQAATIFENNTVVNVHPDFDDRFGNPNVGSAINLFVDEPTGSPGAGAYVAGNIFLNAPRVFGNVDLPDGQFSQLQFENNLVDDSLASSSVGQRPGTLFSLGQGNRIGDPRLADPAGGDFTLRAGSAAWDGIQGRDHGANVPAGAWLSGEPDAVTAQRSASLTVGGPGIFAYRYRVNGGAYSDPIAIGGGFDVSGTTRTDTIELDNLAEGPQTVEVLGQDFAGNWQQQPTVSRTWIVQARLDGLMINEVLASNQTKVRHFGAYPDLIELHNSGSQQVNLRGYSLSDERDDPGKFVFRQDLVLAPGAYVRLFADSEATQGLHTGFSLRREGEGVYLFAPVRVGRRDLVDAVEFGIQIPDFSIGRVGPDRAWALTEPTLGGPNQAARIGDVAALRINEWLSESVNADDFLELYNRDSLPVALGGLFLTDAVDGSPQRHAIAPLSFIAGRGFTAFVADGDPRDADHLNFRLSLDQEALGLVDQQLNRIDTVIYHPQTIGVSQGRLADGQATLQVFDFPTPGWPNGTGLRGDVNQDSELDAADIDSICQAIRDATPVDDVLDLNRDGLLTIADQRHLVEVILATRFGDANLDAVFNSSDLVVIFSAGEYEDAIAGNSNWGEGDWNCDGDFSTTDLLIAFQGGGYSSAANVARAAAATAVMSPRMTAAIDDPARPAPELRGGREKAVQHAKPSLLRPTQLELVADLPHAARADAYFAEPDASDGADNDELYERLATPIIAEGL